MKRNVIKDKPALCPECGGEREFDGIGNEVCYFCGFKSKVKNK